jgi:hypothetical protein
MVIYVAYGYMTDNKDFRMEAYESAYVKLDAKKLFAVPHP